MYVHRVNLGSSQYSSTPCIEHENVSWIALYPFSAENDVPCEHFIVMHVCLHYVYARFLNVL
jgi:hypothetical protein